MDKDTLQRLRDGDQDTYNQVYEKYYKLIWHIVNKYKQYDKEELFAEGCVGFVKAVNTYDPEKSSFTTWLVTIVNNECLMYIRKQRRHPMMCSLNKEFNVDGNTVVLEDLIKDAFDIEKAVIYKDLVERVERISDNKGIMALHREGLNQRQIAERLGITQSYVSRLISAHYKKTRRMLV